MCRMLEQCCAIVIVEEWLSYCTARSGRMCVPVRQYGCTGPVVCVNRYYMICIWYSDERGQVYLRAELCYPAVYQQCVVVILNKKEKKEFKKWYCLLLLVLVVVVLVAVIIAVVVVCQYSIHYTVSSNTMQYYSVVLDLHTTILYIIQVV